MTLKPYYWACCSAPQERDTLQGKLDAARAANKRLVDTLKDVIHWGEPEDKRYIWEVLQNCRDVLADIEKQEVQS